MGMGAVKPWLLLGDRRLDLLVCQDERNKGRLAATFLVSGQTRQSVAAIDYLFYGKEQDSILNDDLRGLARPLRPTPMPIGS